MYFLFWKLAEDILNLSILYIFIDTIGVEKDNVFFEMWWNEFNDAFLSTESFV